MDGKGNEDEKSEPGASRHGNFINYYQFHPAEERVRQLPRDVWRSFHSDRKYVALDVGCNAGDLSYALHTFLKENVRQEGTETALLGIDLDPILIERAESNNPNSHQITFQCLDFLSDKRDSALKQYLEIHKRNRFDVAFCFSITMWIHLNHGDSGLKKFLEAVCDISHMIVVEPQLWRCYRNASRRLRRANVGDFPLLDSLELRGDVASHIEEILSQRGFRKVAVTEINDWQRKMLIYENKH